MLSDVKFAVFLVLLGVFFWLPFWAFFNLCALYVDSNLDTAALYQDLRGRVSAPWLADFLSHTDEHGVRRVLGETISHTGWIIMLLQLFDLQGLREASAPCRPSCSVWLSPVAGSPSSGWPRLGASALVFLGILLFALGEMICSPRIQEYITWIAPKEKAGLYMGSNFLATAIGGALSGVVYTRGLWGFFERSGHPEWTWYVMGLHAMLAALVFWVFVKFAGEFKQQTV